MSRKIVIQERVAEPSDFNFRVVFWADVPTARQSFYADATLTSTVKDASGAELTAIRNGVVLERSQVVAYVTGTTAAQVKADLIARFNAYQAEANARNPYQFFGTSWDGTSWTPGGAS